MPAAQGPLPDFSSISVLIVLAACLCVLAACLCVAFWRTTLRIVATLIIALACFGAVLIIAELHHLATST